MLLGLLFFFFYQILDQIVCFFFFLNSQDTCWYWIDLLLGLFKGFKINLGWSKQKLKKYYYMLKKKKSTSQGVRLNPLNTMWRHHRATPTFSPPTQSWKQNFIGTNYFIIFLQTVNIVSFYWFLSELTIKINFSYTISLTISIICKKFHDTPHFPKKRN